jgi:hypothetical protein
VRSCPLHKVESEQEVGVVGGTGLEPVTPAM